jgi:hypothetical protein
MNKMSQAVDYHIYFPSVNNFELHHYILHRSNFHYIHFALIFIIFTLHFQQLWHCHIFTVLNGKFGYCIVCLDFAIMPNIFVKQK